MLTDPQKNDVRRHCGFPVYGNNDATPPSFGYRYYEQYMTLEYRMNNLSLDQETLLLTKYIANCNTLEDAIPTASSNLDTKQAAVWYHNEKEVRDRWDLYKLWCKRLIEFMGLETPSAMLSGVRIVV